MFALRIKIVLTALGIMVYKETDTLYFFKTASFVFGELRVLVAFEKRKFTENKKITSALRTRSMNILDEILCIDEEEIDYEQDRVEELQYENLSDKGNSTPIKTEASLTTSNSPAPKPSSASNDGFLSFHKFLFSKPCQLFVVGGTNMFGKLEFLQCLEPAEHNSIISCFLSKLAMKNYN